VPVLNQAFHFTWFRETVEFVFRKDQLAVHKDVEHASFASDELGVNSELLFE
jgi:hypothetical protein